MIVSVFVGNRAMQRGHTHLRRVLALLLRQRVLHGGVQRQRQPLVRLLELRVETVLPVQPDVLADERLEVRVHVQDRKHAVELAIQKGETVEPTK